MTRPRALRQAAIVLLLLTAASARGRAQDAAILDVRVIWDRAPHNAFTDLVRLRDRWYCALREGEGHVSHDGKIRIISSDDGESWRSAALLGPPGDLPDMRDAKLSVTPAGRLVVAAAAADRRTKPSRHQTYLWFSDDGVDFKEVTPIGDPNFWLWRVTWQRDAAYSVGYETTSEKFIRLYRSEDGRKFDTLVPRLFDVGYPNETSLLFLEDKTCLCLLRRDGNPSTAMLGRASPPYTDWTWRDLGVRLGGPHMIQLPDGRIVAAGRLYDGAVRTSLLWLDPNAEKPALKEFLKLPSGGDTSYPGLVYHNDTLWVSYYASHEGKSKIYLARVKLPKPASP